MVMAKCSGAFKHCIDELLSDPKVKGKIADTKAAEHSRALDNFYKRLESDPDRTCYGQLPVEKAVAEGAVSELLVTDKLFRSANAALRRKYAGMVDIVRQSRGTVHVFSEKHITGQQLNQLGGVAAMLRYAVSDD
jgi:protein pelota